MLAVGMVVLSGCSGPTGLSTGSSANVAVLKSADSGGAYEPKNKVNEKQVVGAEVLSFLIDRSNARHLYIGTKEDGIYTSEDAGDTWKKINYVPNKVYGLAQDPANSSIIYATGEWQSRGKVYRSEDAGTTWKEIYTEPANGPVITALAQDPTRSGELLVGLSTGVIVRTTDSGHTWGNVPSLPAAVTSINYDPHRPDWVYAIISGKGLYRSQDRGATFAQLSVKTPPPANVKARKNDPNYANYADLNVFAPSAMPVSLAFDPLQTGVLYVGTEKEGVWHTGDGGETWDQLNILASSKQYAVRAVAVSPFDSNEIMYSGAQAVYKSVNRGVEWSTYQLNTASVVGSILYDSTAKGVIYLGFRSF